MSPPRKIPVDAYDTIRARVAAGETLRAIAADYGVSHVAIFRIVRLPSRPRCPECGRPKPP